MTSLQLLLLLLSALRQMDAFRYPSYEFHHRPHHFSRTANKKECAEQEVISHWISEQVERNTKITRFNQRLREMLNVLRENNTTAIEKENCCFYEKNTMDNLFKDINILSEKYDIAGGAALQKTGDIGQDLDLIMGRMHKLVAKDIEGCCDRLSKDLKELEADFEKQLENLKHNFAEKKDLKKNPETELKQLGERIEKLEAYKKQSQDKECCKELDIQLNELEQQLKSAKTNPKDNPKNLEKDSINPEDSKIKDIKDELKKRAQDMKNIMEKCEKNCINVQNNEKNLSNTAPNDLKRLDNLEQLIHSLIQNHKKLHNMIETLQQCPTPQNNCPTDLQKDSKELEPQIEKAKNCCKNIDNLEKSYQDLYGMIKQMNDSFNNHVSKLDADIKNLEMDIVQGTIYLMPELNTNSNASSQENLEAIDNKIKQIQNTLYNNDYKLLALQSNSTKNYEDLNQLIADQRKKTEDFQKLSEQRYDDLIAKTNSDKPVVALDRLDRLEKQQNQLIEDIDKGFQLENQVKDFEKQLKDALDKLNQTQSHVGDCTAKCDHFDKIEGIIDRIEDLEALKPKKIRKPTKKKPRESIIGGVDFR